MRRISCLIQKLVGLLTFRLRLNHALLLQPRRISLLEYMQDSFGGSVTRGGQGKKVKGQSRLEEAEGDSVWLDGDSTQSNLIYLRVIPCTRSPEFDFSQPQSRFLVAARITGIPTHAAGPRIMVSTIVMSQKGPVNMEVLVYSITQRIEYNHLKA